MIVKSEKRRSSASDVTKFLLLEITLALLLHEKGSKGSFISCVLYFQNMDFTFANSKLLFCLSNLCDISYFM